MTSLEFTTSMGGCCMPSMITIRANILGMPTTISGGSSTMLTMWIASTLHSSSYTTYSSLPRLLTSARPPDSSFCTKRRCISLKNVCGRWDNSKMQVHAACRELTHYTELKKHWLSWITRQQGNRHLQNVGVPPEKGWCHKTVIGLLLYSYD